MVLLRKIKLHPYLYLSAAALWPIHVQQDNLVYSRLLLFSSVDSCPLLVLFVIRNS